MPHAPDDLDLAKTMKRAAPHEILVGRYRIVRTLGSGAMGTVYLAQDMQMSNREVAIKVPHQVLAHTKRAIADLRREAEAAIDLRHQAIVPFYNFEAPEGSGAFLIMKYIKGQTLDDLLAEKGKLSVAETLDLLRPIAEALDYAHSQNVIHRDLKPSNILIDDQGKAHLTDFGIARQMKDTLTKVTGKQEASGTLAYMSPEQHEGQRPSKAQDIYSFGVLMYECLTGDPPFCRGDIPYQIHNTAPDAEALKGVAGLPRGIADVVLRCLAKKNNDRPKQAHSLFRVPVTPAQNPTDVKSSSQGGARPASEASDKTEPNKAFAPKDIAEVERLRKEANQGKPAAMTSLGYMYSQGLGIEQDDTEAVWWYRRAADLGRAVAMRNLGLKYAAGSGVSQDDEEAIRWYRRAIAAGEAAAMSNLGFMYREGRGVGQDDNEAVNWYRKAADAGNATGMRNLGWMYEQGRGVVQDDNEAVKWFRKAADAGEATAMSNLGVMYEQGRGVVQDDNEAVNWYRKAADAGNAAAMTNLGWMHEMGRGVTKDYDEAARLYRLAADAGRAMAMRNLGRVYQNGLGVTKSGIKAVKWYKRAAELGDQKAADALERLKA